MASTRKQDNKLTNDSPGPKRNLWDRLRLSLQLSGRLVALARKFSRIRLYLLIIFDVFAFVAEFFVVGAIAFLIMGLEGSAGTGMVDLAEIIPVSLPVPLPALSDLAFLSVCTLSIAAGMAAAGLAGYWARHYEATISIVVEQVSQTRLLNAVANLPPWTSAVQGYRLDDPLLNQMLRNDPRYCGRMVGDAVAGIVPFATLLICFASLFLLQPLVTGLMVGMVLLTAPLFLNSNREAARATLNFETQMGAASQSIRALQNWMLQEGKSARRPFSDFGVELENQTFETALKTYHKLQILAQSSTLGTRLIQAAAVGGTLYFGGSVILSGEGSWAELVSFVMVLRMAFNYMQRAAQVLIAVNRFALMVNRYFNVVDEAEAETATYRPSGKSPAPCCSFLAADGTRLDLLASATDAPIRLACFTKADTINRLLLAALFRSSKPADSTSWLYSTAIVVESLPSLLDSKYPNLTIGRWLSLTNTEAAEERFREFASGLNSPEVNAWLNMSGFDAPLKDVARKTDVLVAAQMFAADQERHTVLLIHGKTASEHKDLVNALLAEMRYVRLAVLSYGSAPEVLQGVRNMSVAGAVGISGDQVIWTLEPSRLDSSNMATIEKLAHLTDVGGTGGEDDMIME